MQRTYLFLQLVFLIMLHIDSAAQTEHFIDVNSPSGLFNYKNTLFVGTYAGVSYKHDLNSESKSESVFNSNVFRTTYHNKNLYYSDSWNYIFKYDIDSGINSVLFGDGSNIFGVSTYENDLYYSEWSLGEIWKIDLDEEIVSPELILSGLDTLGAIIVNSGILYIAETGSGSIFKMDLSSNYPRLDTLFYGEFVAPNELYIIDEFMYVSDFSANKVSRFSLKSGAPFIQDIVFNIKSPTGLTSDDDYLYISSLENDEILRYPLDLIREPKIIEPERPIVIHPNPNFGKFVVSNLSQKEEYKIYDAAGKLIQTGIVGNNEEVELLDKKSKTLYLKIDNSELIAIHVIQ